MQNLAKLLRIEPAFDDPDTVRETLRTPCTIPHHSRVHSSDTWATGSPLFSRQLGGGQ